MENRNEMPVSAEIQEEMRARGLEVLMVFREKDRDIVVTKGGRDRRDGRDIKSGQAAGRDARGAGGRDIKGGQVAARRPARPVGRAPAPAGVEEAARRFEICKGCEHSRNDGFGCEFWHGCCFGKYRGRADAVCRDNPPRWGKSEGTEGTEGTKGDGE